MNSISELYDEEDEMSTLEIYKNDSPDIFKRIIKRDINSICRNYNESETQNKKEKFKYCMKYNKSPLVTQEFISVWNSLKSNDEDSHRQLCHYFALRPDKQSIEILDKNRSLITNETKKNLEYNNNYPALVFRIDLDNSNNLIDIFDYIQEFIQEHKNEANKMSAIKLNLVDTFKIAPELQILLNIDEQYVFILMKFPEFVTDAFFEFNKSSFVLEYIKRYILPNEPLSAKDHKNLCAAIVNNPFLSEEIPSIYLTNDNVHIRNTLREI
jgi:hypothetical protein